MHFITGGAFNGKRKWVKKHYTTGQYLMLTAYEQESLSIYLDTDILWTVVLEGIEKYIYTRINTELSADDLRENIMNEFTPWFEWELAENRRELVIIGTDISKGIVPMEKRDRLWRDVTGWVYQDMVNRAERVDIIWYGMAQNIKNIKGM